MAACKPRAQRRSHNLLRMQVQQQAPAAKPASGNAHALHAPLSGNLWKYQVKAGDTVKAGDVVVILEAMKMETEVRADRDGTIVELNAREGDSVISGDVLLTIEGNA